MPGSSVASQATGVGAWCTGSLSYTVHSTADVDGNGVENLAHRLAAIVNNGGGLGAVRIFWVRQVSDPPATPTFGDVPATDGGYPFIEALSASGITVGCAGGNFCPDAPLTRRQMAAKALGLHWPN